MKNKQKKQSKNQKNWFIDTIFNYNQLQLEEYIDNILEFNKDNTELGLVDEVLLGQNKDENVDGYVEAQIIYANLIQRCLNLEWYELIPKLKLIQKYEFDNLVLILKYKGGYTLENIQMVQALTHAIQIEKIQSYLNEEIASEIVNYILKTTIQKK